MIELLKRTPKRYFLYLFAFIFGIVWLYLLHENEVSEFINHILSILREGMISLNAILLSKNSNGGTFISDIFMGLGSASIGALAIIFSISLFAAQQSYATYSQGAVKIFLKDKVSFAIYITISGLTLFFYALSTFDKTDLLESNLGEFFCGGIFGLLILIALIFFHYYRVTDIISPVYVVQYFSQRGLKKLKFKDRRNKLKTSSESGVMSTKDQQKYIKILSFVPSLKNDIEEISNVIKKYRDRREYSIVSVGLAEISRISIHYIDAKKRLFFGSHSELYLMPGVTEISHDNFLDDPDGVFEKLKHISSIAGIDKDIETIKRVTISLKLISLKALEIDYIGEHISENHVFMSGLGYIDTITNEIGSTLPDVSIHTSGIINEMTDHVFGKDRKSIFMNASKLVQTANTIAFQGLINGNARFLINKGLESILKIIFYSYLTDEIPIKRYVEMFIEKNIKTVIQFYVKNIQSSGVDFDFALGNAFGDLNKFSIPNLIRSICKRIEATTDDTKRKTLVNELSDLNRVLWQFYESILKTAGKNQSEVILYISRDLQSIIFSLVSLEQNILIKASHKRNVIEAISWYFSNYWRIYDFHDKISKNYYLFIEENILSLGVLFHSVGYQKLMGNVINTIIVMAKFYNKKQDENNEYIAPRMLLTGLKYALFTGKTGSFLKELRLQIERGEFTLEKDQWQIFINEYPDINKNESGIRDTSESAICSAISDVDLDSFLPTLTGFLKNKDIFPSQENDSSIEESSGT